MPAKEDLFAWDTCVLLDYIQPQEDADPRECEYLQELVSNAVRDDRPIVIPASVLTEVCHCQSSDRHRQRALNNKDLELVRAFFRRHEFEVRPLDRVAAERAQEFRRAGLAFADALVAGICVRNKVNVLLTRDGTARKKKRKTLISQDGVYGDPALRIMRPSDHRDLEFQQQAPLYHPTQTTGDATEPEPPSARPQIAAEP